MNSKSLGLFDDEFQHPIPQVEAPKSTKAEKDLSAYPQEIQQTTYARLKYIRWLKERIVGGWTEKNLAPLINEMPKVEGADKPNWRTAARWFKSYSESDESIFALIPKHQKKGKRTQRTDTDKFFEKALERFLVKERPSVSSAYQYYKDLVVIENEKVIGEDLRPLTYKAFKNRIDKLPHYEVLRARYGKRIADLAYNKVESHKRPTRVLERVEVDHTPLDLILLDDELQIPLGRPTLTILIDVYSHCIVGFYLGFNDPSYDAIRRAMLNAMKPKNWIKEQYPDITHDWHCCGKIETLVVDNGVEFWSNSFESACAQIGISLQYNPVGKPWLKPFVERIFGVINTQLLDPIPGKTFSNMMKKEGYDPNKDAIMRFSAFMEVFHHWIIDVYHQEADSRFSYIPALEWDRGYEQLPPAPLSSDDIQRLEIVLGISTWRHIRKGGIHFENLRYDSNELADYRKRFSPKASVKLMLKVNPEDLSRVYAFLPELDHYIEVLCIDPNGYTAGLSLHQHKVNVRLQRDFIGSHMDVAALARARMLIHEKIQNEVELLANSTKKPKARGGKALAKYQNVASDNLVSVKPSSPTKKPPEKVETEEAQNKGDWDDFVSDLEGF
ncbi:Mu transposase C-terminal domain-containing protein [Pseudoalteromonas ruthenica]|uniref:Mu transposase C-terminal domain-containing protein n=1 Tax=Pseudoalteromonas ruthenica TaxID=151081 RepID=UPI00110B09BD|nr:Mu transposase C-terminal domain-containing protein [Pseudoalteromonas ruthenica]TMO85511.1 integrase [Pseudoalteromonas ruthenica]TMP22815.1 integrase [Pseudoalteromonas ruthenica]USN27136.1 TnsB integrase [synthetic construct]